MQGMHADGSKASGFRSMVVAQFTAVSIQKDDRAFVKYNSQSRVYEGIIVDKVTGSALSSGSSSTNAATVYHLDPDAVYRRGWKTTHIKISNDSFIQIVSVFAIGFRAHFEALSGSDGSITNSNSNFGQVSLACDGFKREAFDKDDKAYITSVITPRAVVAEESDIDWISLDVGLTTSVGISSHLYLFGFNNRDDVPPVITQGYRIGARAFDKLYFDYDDGTGIVQTFSSDILMVDRVTSNVSYGLDSAQKRHTALAPNSQFIFDIGTNNIKLGEKIIMISEIGDLPENVIPNYVYYAITNEANTTRTDGVTLNVNQIQLATSKTNAEAATPIPLKVYGGRQLVVLSRVSEKIAGEIGSPIQWDSVNSNWYVHANSNNDIYNALSTFGVALLTERSDVTYIKRFEDSRSLDEKIFKVRVVVPKELVNARDPSEGFIIQESATTGVRANSDFTLTDITSADYLFERNPRFISTCTYNNVLKIITVRSDLPHNLNVGDQITIRNVKSTTNTLAAENKGYNGVFLVSGVIDDKTFTYPSTDIFDIVHNPGTFTNNTHVREATLPRFERNNNQGNFSIYRSEVISPYIFGVQDGVYHVYLINSSNQIESEFTDSFYTQNITDLYPQLDKDNIDDNPLSARTYAKRSPLGEVVTNDLKKSLTRETIDKFYKNFGIVPVITNVSTSPTSVTVTLNREHGLGAVVTGTISGGSGHTPGTYYNVKLFNEISLNTWDGATAKVVVGPSGNVTSAEVISGGSAYTNGETLYFDSFTIGGTPSASYSISSVGISTAIGNVVEFTGIGTVTDKYHRITALPAKNQITIAKAASEDAPVVGQYVLNNGPSIYIVSTSYNSATEVTTFNCGQSHGLLTGNKIRIIDSSNANLGDFVVLSRNSVTSFTAKTGSALVNPVYILKHAISSNEAVSDNSGENLGVRSIPLLENDSLQLLSDISSESTFPVRLINSGIGTTRRFPVGSYIQIDNEIMRITGSTLTGPSNNQITVIRGSMGTLKENHSNGSVIRKIKPLAIELRRPSIIRASGHTFEYLGYGPGNYSTALPQVQVKTLTEREDFLSQSQETSCGSVIYTGMNSDGDFFIGNTKYSASSGEQITFDIPIPTVTGQDPSRLSVVFDEVIVKERLLVEGGNSGTILSQFDGPVTFNQNVTINKDLKLNGRVFILNKTESTSIRSGALVVSGGVGISKNVNIGGETTGTLFKASTGYTPLSNLGAYLGTTINRFSEAHIGNIQIAPGAADGTITTRSGGGNLTITADVGSNVAITTTTTLSGNLTLTGNNVVPGPDSGTLTARYLAVPNITPIGSVVMWAGRSDNLPSNPGIIMWAICNGQALNTYQYSSLHSIISNTYGGTAYVAGVTDQPSATTTFNIPNLTNQFVIASSGNGGTSVTGTTTRSGGSKDASVVTHNHTLTGDGSHPHGVTVASSGTLSMSGSADSAGSGHSHSGSVSGNAPHSHPGSTNPAGSHSHGYTSVNGNTGAGGQNRPTNPNPSNTNPAGDHAHGVSVGNANAPFSASVSVSGGGHSHPTSVSGASHGHPGSTVTGPGAHPHTVEPSGVTGTNLNLPPYFSLFYIMRVV
jgi:microcystin-dependent protein